MIHITSVTFPCNSSYEVTVTGNDFARAVLFDSRTGTGLGISVPSLENSNLSYISKEHTSHGRLTRDGLNTFGLPANNDNAYINVNTIDEVSGCWLPATDMFTETNAFTATNRFTRPFVCR
jgi:hypothetical protein